MTGGEKVLLNIPDPILTADEGWGKTGRQISFFKDIAILAVPADKKEIAFEDVLNLTGRKSWTPRRVSGWSTGLDTHQRDVHPTLYLTTKSVRCSKLIK